MPTSLGRFDENYIDTAGNAQASLAVEIRRQGAQAQAVSGTSPLTVTVENLGAILASDTVIIVTALTGAVGTTTYNVTSINRANSTLVLSGFGGTLALANNDRISPTNALPSIYKDINRAEAETNPLTTSSSGQATCWIAGGFYDVVTGTGATAKMFIDVHVPAEDTSIVVMRSPVEAVGDGSTDNTTVIQKALDFNASAVGDGGPGVLDFGPGTFLAQTLYVRPGTIIRGIGTGNNGTTGRGTIFKIKTSTNLPMFRSENFRSGFTLGTDDANMHGVFFQDFRIEGNSANNTSAAHGIEWSGTGFTAGFQRLLITDCKGDGIHLGASTHSPSVSSDRFQIQDCGISICTGSGIYAEGTSGFQALLLNSLKVDNCREGVKITGLPDTGAQVSRQLCMVELLNCRFEFLSTSGGGLMQNGIYLDELRGTQVILIGVKFWQDAAASQRTGAAIRNEGTSNGVEANVMLIGCDQVTNSGTPMYAKLFDDTTLATAMEITDGPVSFASFLNGGAVVANYFMRQLDARVFDGDRGIAVQRFGQTHPAVQMNDATQGQILWGSGLATPDTNLYRSAANTLKTDDALIVAGALTASGITTASSSVDISGRIRLNSFEDVAIATTISVTKNNVRITGNGPVTLSTINVDAAAPGAAHDGMEVTIVRAVSGTADYTIDQGGNILLEAGATIVLTGGQVASFKWCNAESKWIQMAPKAAH